MRWRLGQAKVEDLGLSGVPACGSGYEDVGGLDVAVDDAFGVRGHQPVGNLNRQVEKRRRLERTSLHQALESASLEELHDHEWLAQVLADVIDGADVGMIQGRGCARLAPKAFQRLGAGSRRPARSAMRPAKPFGTQKLDRHWPAQASVFGLIDHPHATAAQFRQDTVV